MSSFSTPFLFTAVAFQAAISSSSGAPLGDVGAAHLRAAPTGGAIDAPSAPGFTADQLPRVRVSEAATPQLADLDDSPPLPTPAVVVDTPNGDVMKTPASGDPYFLGFAAGEYRPAPGERVDPELLARVEPAPRDGRPAPTVYAFAMFEKRITPARVARLESLGVRVLGYHPNNCLRVAIPVGAFEAVAADPDLHWLGTPKRWQKFSPLLAGHLAQSTPGALVDLVVDVFDSDLNADSTSTAIASAEQFDAGVSSATPPAAASSAVRVRSNGWQQRALEQAGLEVGDYAESIRAFYVRGTSANLALLADLDFVQYIEPHLPAGALHDDSTPMVYSDSTRYYYSGGVSQSVVAGIFDTGVDVAHTDLNHVWGVGWQFSGTGGVWHDVCEHGSHVSGTILGNGATNAAYTGNAPGLGWGGAGRFYAVKVSDACSGWSFSLPSYIAPFQTPYFDGVNTSPIPMVINNSWGDGPAAYTGTEADPRTIDGEVYSRGQIYAFAAGNNGPGASTLSSQASSKNAFTVGSVTKTWSSGVTLPGELSSFSSRGPTGDSRWKPNLVAPGDSINSVDANSTNGYDVKSGTSMATPHVTGVIAQMLDHLTFLRYAPERTHSLLMASAMTKANALLTSPTDSHLRTYGAGRLEAFKANFGTSQYGWSNWGAFLPANNYTWADFSIGAGCTRLVVCMNYSDVAASAGASKALVNNFDLYIDQPPIDPNFNTGDYVLQQSSNDNTEIRILDNPAAGTWRWKIWPTSTTSGVYYGLTVFAIYGDLTPDVSLSVTPAKTYLKPFETTPVTVNVFSPSYVASNVVVEPDYHFGNGSATSVYKYLNDGAYAPKSGGSYVNENLGDILHGNSRSAVWNTYWASEGIWGFVVNARGDNVSTVNKMGVVTVDGTPPTMPPGLQTPANTPGTWSNNPWLLTTWSASADNLSGVAGYSYTTYPGAILKPDAIIETTGLSAFSFMPTSTTGYYFALSSVDLCGNVSPYTYVGPYYFDTMPPSAITGVNANIPVNGSGCGEFALSWDPASDAHSGLAGYSVLVDDQPNTTPSGAISAATEQYLATLPPSASAYYAHVVAVDVAGNLGAQADYGPFYVQATSVTHYCVSKVNSLGCTPAIDAVGCSSYSAGDLQVTASQIIGGTSGRLLWSVTPSAFTGAGAHSAIGASRVGTKICLLNANLTPTQSSGGTLGQCDGAFAFDFGAATLQSFGLTPGTAVYAQYVFDDPNAPDGSKLGQTDALTFEVAP